MQIYKHNKKKINMILLITLIFNVCQKTNARYCYRLDVCLSIRHMLVLCQNASIYRQTVFTTW